MGGIIFDIKRFSVHDGPGIRTTVFFKGCPLRCQWCHNPESQRVRRELMVWRERCIGCGACVSLCEQGVAVPDRVRGEGCILCGQCVDGCYAEARQMVGREMSVQEVMAEVERDIAFYDESGGGVTFSGGEPLLQPTFLYALLQACQAKEIHTAVDTCGWADWAVLDCVRPHVDLFLYDLKLIDEVAHRRWTGRSNDRILDNLRRLSAFGQRIILRVAIVPTINDDAQSVRQIGSFAAKLPGLERVDLLPYHRAGAEKYTRLARDFSLPGIRPPTKEKMAEIARVFTALGLQVKVGG
ncbi:MAG: glycyl-radical enzyme activating protein [Anaerolineae bacterium]|nr:glycyl-radical enzyme activating protein [Anaerolineae bacterium]